MGSSDEPDRTARPGLDDTVPASSESTSPPEPRRSSPTLPPPPGQERYQVKSELGRGGMGRVVEALDIQLGRVVAVKEVLPKAGTGSARRFEREVALTARLEHPSIVPLYDSGTTVDGRPYYVMRRVSGRPLDELISRARRFEDRLAYLPAVQQAIDAIAHAHRRGVIHRDLKPANILIGELGETVVIDWGLAKVIGEDDEPATRDSLPSDSLQTQIGSVFGTPGFMAPEQARGEEIGTGGDVYALGATLYHLLAGVPPHTGHSATAVLEKTLKHTMTPLTELAPGAPPELVAIVNKALAHDAGDRYPDAAALGEDLRRFLTGQLVAAHRYTPGQHLARFARRHRTALVVAALSLVAFAVFAVFSVVRIMQERDAANAARAEAIAGRSAAEQAHRELAVRHDALVISNARARLDDNPTAALATVKLVPPSSSLLHDARGVAQAAVMRGVTWAVQSTDVPTTIAQLSPDAKRLVQVSRDGMVRIWDLERRRLAHQRSFAALTRAVWIAGGKLLVTHHEAPPVVFDPTTNALANVDLAPIAMAFASSTGDRVVFIGADGAGVLDAATLTARRFAAAKVHDVAIAADGKLVAYTEDAATVIADGEGKELARYPKRAVRVVLSTARTAALLVDNKVLEVALDAPRPVFVEIERAWRPADIVLDLGYRGRELIALAGLAFWGWDGKRTGPRGQLPSLSGGFAVAEDLVAALSIDNRLQLFGQSPTTVQLPASLASSRLVARADTSRVIVVARGLILGLDLDHLRPRVVATGRGNRAWFVDDDTLLVNAGTEWRWIDIASGAVTPIDYESPGPIHVVQTEAAGRALIAEDGPFGTRNVLVEKGAAKSRIVVEGAGAWARLVPGNALVFSAGGARVMASDDGGAPRELVKLEGAADHAIPLGHRRVALHATSGELVIADLTTGRIERATVAVGPRGVMAVDAQGRLVIAEDKRVLVWDGTVKQIATFEQPVIDMRAVEGGMAIVLADFETYLLELVPSATPQRAFAASKFPPAIAADGRVMVGAGNADQLDVLELPSRARWTAPPQAPITTTGLALSPSRRRVLQHVYGTLVIRRLPAAPATDFAAWLAEHTNATIDASGELVWPWQRPNAAP